MLYRSSCTGKSPLGLASLLLAALLCSWMGTVPKERCIWHSARCRDPHRACTGQFAGLPARASDARQPGPGLGFRWRWRCPSTHPRLGVDTARSGVTRDLHGCSLTWFEPVSAAGFASVQLSWFCFAAVIVFSSNAASFLSSKHWLSKATIPLAWIQNCLPWPLSPFLFLSRSLPHGSPKQNVPVPQRVGAALLTPLPKLPSAALQGHPQSLSSALWTTKSPNSLNLIWIRCGPAAPFCRAS